MEDLVTSDVWATRLGYEGRILDPDGWDRRNFKYSFYEEKITKSEFLERLYKSTLRGLCTDKPR